MLSLEDIVDCSEDLSVRANRNIYGTGLYCPDILTVYFNPFRIWDKEEFIVTILHEFCHHKEEELTTYLTGLADEQMELTEFLTELIAEQMYQIPEIKEYVESTYKRQIQRYWGGSCCCLPKQIKRI